MRNSYSARCGDEKRGIDMKWSELKPKKNVRSRQARESENKCNNNKFVAVSVVHTSFSALTARRCSPSIFIASISLSLAFVHAFVWCFMCCSFFSLLLLLLCFSTLPISLASASVSVLCGTLPTIWFRLFFIRYCNHEYACVCLMWQYMQTKSHSTVSVVVVFFFVFVFAFFCLSFATFWFGI